MNDEGGTVVGDVENLKIWTFGYFDFLSFFLWVELFLRFDMMRRWRDVKWWKVLERRRKGRMCCKTDQSSGKIENVKGNALGTDFVHFLIKFCSDTYHWSFELSKCSLKYEPSLLTKQTSLGWDNADTATDDHSRQYAHFTCLKQYCAKRKLAEWWWTLHAVWPTSLQRSSQLCWCQRRWCEDSLASPRAAGVIFLDCRVPQPVFEL